jgi:hypothetical protein
MNTRYFVEKLPYFEKIGIIYNSNDPVLNDEEDLIVHIEENPEEYQDLFERYNVLFD